ncbi:MAG: efflux transporter outer membrane subunit [Desulfobacteraceae bacterium]|nr:efflux transporter outer membrane subunit [Desulfobacteraceae bacterium]
MKTAVPIALLAIMAAVAASGCMRVGPDYKRPEPGFEIPDQYLSAGNGQTSDYVPADRWWEDFGDPGLNSAVAAAVKNNPGVAEAAAGVMEARAALRQADADRFPSVDLEANASTQKSYQENPLTGETVSVETDTFSLSVPASFEIDLWGRLARASQAARADLLAAEENRRTVVQSLVGETVNLYLRIRFLERQITITRDLVKSHEQNLELVEDRYKRGLASMLDVRQAERSLARAEAELPSLLNTRGAAFRSLSVLQGKYPENGELKQGDQTGFLSLCPVPAGLPSELLSRRPDIRAAEASLEAACARIGVARANRLPRISLTGSFGYTSDELSALFDPENRLSRIAAGGFQSLFDAGARAAAEKAARARYEKQLASYAKTLLNAFAEVEDALFAARRLRERRDRLERLVSESEATLETAMDRYNRGLAGYLNVLDARQSLFQAELDLAQAEYAIYENRVKLYRALGGGWDRNLGLYGDAHE